MIWLLTIPRIHLSLLSLYMQFSSVAQSCPTLRPQESQHTRPPSATPGVYSNSCPWSRWCHPAISSSPPAPNPSQHQGFSNESTLHMRWPKYWSFSFSISPSNKHPGLISFRMDWLDLLAVQGTLKSLLQHHSSNTSIFWRSDLYNRFWLSSLPLINEIHSALGILAIVVPRNLCSTTFPVCTFLPVKSYMKFQGCLTRFLTQN